jgi:hypothetical protein
MGKDHAHEAGIRSQRSRSNMLTLTRTKNRTDTRSELMVSPIAQRLWDLDAGHCRVRVLLQMPLGSRVKFSVSVLTIRLATTFALLVLAEPPENWNGEEYDEGGEADGV